MMDYYYIISFIAFILFINLCYQPSKKIETDIETDIEKKVNEDLMKWEIHKYSTNTHLMCIPKHRKDEMRELFRKRYV